MISCNNERLNRRAPVYENKDKSNEAGRNIYGNDGDVGRRLVLTFVAPQILRACRSGKADELAAVHEVAELFWWSRCALKHK